MKKILLTFVGLVSCSIIYAQEVDNFKPIQGNVTAELNVNPFNGQISLNNTINQLRGRYFVKNDIALRVGLGLNMVDTVGTTGDPYGTNSNYRSMTFKSNAYDLSIGVEKHFNGTKRLSPFVGIEVSYGNKNSKYTEKTSNYELEVENGWYEQYIEFNNGGWSRTRMVQLGYKRFGVAAIAGFDFYISKNFYFGYEFNLAYNSTDYKEPKITSSGSYTQSNNEITDNSSSNFGAKLSNGIRLGFAF